MSRPKPSGRSYGRLTRHERTRSRGCSTSTATPAEIAAELGRSPSTVTRRWRRTATITAPRSHYGEPAPADDLSGACPGLSAWPRCCNGCSHRRGYGCSRRRGCSTGAGEGRRGGPPTPSSRAAGPDRRDRGGRRRQSSRPSGTASRAGSPAADSGGDPRLNASTVYRWVDAG